MPSLNNLEAVLDKVKTEIAAAWPVTDRIYEDEFPSIDNTTLPFATIRVADPVTADFLTVRSLEETLNIEVFAVVARDDDKSRTILRQKAALLDDLRLRLESEEVFAGVAHKPHVVAHNYDLTAGEGEDAVVVSLVLRLSMERNWGE